jgi:SnoaL-like domain
LRAAGVTWAQTAVGVGAERLGRETVVEAKTKVTIEERIARIRGTFEAMARDDVDKELEGYTEDAVLHSQLRGSDFRGKAAIRTEALKQSDELKSKMVLHDVCASSDHVVALFEVIPQAGERPGPTDGRLIMVAHVNDEAKITELWSIYKPLA